MIGKTLAHYEIIDLLGKGGMGEVYRARDTKLRRDVALKFLPREFARDSERLQRFEREARVLASVTDPNVAAIYGVEHVGEYRFLVMEYVEGENLQQRLRRGRLDWPEALEITRQIAAGLESAHAGGIVHRDLKPGNVQLTPDGTVKVLDFGLARHETAPTGVDQENSPTVTAAFTEAGAVLGTAPYLSPEAIRGRPVDARSDVWALGCVLYEMLTGTAVFRRGTSSETMAAILESDPEWDALPTSLPTDVARLLRRCLEKDPKQRLHAAADIRIELQDVLVPARASSMAEPPPRGLTRGGVAAIAFVALLLGSAAVGVILQRGPSEVRTTVRLLIPTPDESPVVPLPETSSVAMAPNGEYLVYVAPASQGFVAPQKKDRANLPQLYLRPLNGFDVRPIEGTVGATSPFISPDSQWIGFLSADLKLRKVARSGGAPTEICSDVPVAFRQASWADDGNIYFAGSFSGIHVVDANGGPHRSVATPDREAGIKTLRFPSALPGSRAILLMSGSSEILSYDDADVCVLSLETGRIDVIVNGGMNPRYVPTGHVVYGRVGKLFAVPFDLASLQVTGLPFEVLGGVVTSEGYGSAHYTFSNDGTLVYVAGGPEQFAFEMYILHFDGRLESIPQPARRYGNVKVAPSGNQLALSDLGANASVWVYELQRGTMTKLVSGWDNHSPVWHPKGETIAFGSNRSGAESVWMTSADGSGAAAPLADATPIRYPSSWSPDGKWLACTWESPTGGTDIRFVSVEGEGQARFAIEGPAAEYSGVFSPNGRWVAYNSDESGQTEVYVSDFPVTGRKWKISEDGGAAAVWAPDGRHLYYMSRNRLMAVTIEESRQFRPGRARELVEVELAEISTFDIFPDGKRFVLLARSRANTRDHAPVVRSHGGQVRMFPALSPDLRVVVNWFEELENTSAP